MKTRATDEQLSTAPRAFRTASLRARAERDAGFQRKVTVEVGPDGIYKTTVTLVPVAR